MTRPPTIIDAVLDARWFRDRTRRWLTFGVTAVLFGVLSIWPETYKAEAQLMPQESNGGLSSVLASEASGALLNLSVLTGSRTSIEEDVTIARGHSVIQDAIAKLKLVGRPGYPDARAAEAKLSKKLSVVAIRGSILDVTVHDSDRDFARRLVEAAAQSIQDRLAQISLQQAAQKREVTTNRLADATVRLAKAQEALNQFRLAHKLPAPEQQLGAGVGNLAGLQAQLESKQAQLSALSQIATPQNIQTKVIQADIASLRSQILQAQKASGAQGGGTLASVAIANTQYYNLVRDEHVAELLYQVYSRYLDEITIDEMSAMQNVQLIEPAFVDPRRQYNLVFAGLLGLIIAIAIGAEYYYAGSSVARRRA
jgi:uncharacterized protein involved in exopolysaccharide biosynthesis